MRGEVIRGILESLPHTAFEINIPKEQPRLTDLAEIEEEADAAEVAPEEDVWLSKGPSSRQPAKTRSSPAAPSGYTAEDDIEPPLPE